MANVVATAGIDIAAPAARVWRALTEPDIIKRYFFGTTVETNWQPGSSIVWRGEYSGTKYEDKGKVLEVTPERLLKVTHFSPLTGQPDIPENYHTVAFELEEREGGTHVSLSQDNNHDDAEAEHASQNWRMVLDGLKQTVEEG
ncbi:MAG: SRPBCC domain-containing protein [Candidatus Dormibacteraeota bacterium]|nr:SRPBCC domain-containing protein [Candidatus Dormibacteraeota bacterium]